MTRFNLRDRGGESRWRQTAPVVLAVVLAGLWAGAGVSQYRLARERALAQARVESLQQTLQRSSAQLGEARELARQHSELEDRRLAITGARARFRRTTCDLASVTSLLPAEVVLSEIRGTAGRWLLEGESRTPYGLTTLLARLAGGGLRVGAVEVSDDPTLTRFKIEALASAGASAS